MSSTGFGKARNASYMMSDIVKAQRDIKLLYSLGRVVASPNQTVLPFTTGIHPASAPSGSSSLSINGGSMVGPIAFLRRLGGLDVLGNLDISLFGNFSNYVALTNLGGSSDFRSVSGAINDGQLLIVYNNTGLPITVREASLGNDNIETITHKDVILNNLDFMIFIWDAHPGSLKQITTGSSSNSPYFTTGQPNISLSGMEWPVTIKNSGSYTVDSQNGSGTDYFIKMNDPSFARNVTLPDATLFKGRVITVKHAGSGFNVNVLANAGLGQTIDGAASYTINTLFGSVTVFSDGVNWLIISKVT